MRPNNEQRSFPRQYGLANCLNYKLKTQRAKSLLLKGRLFSDHSDSYVATVPIN